MPLLKLKQVPLEVNHYSKCLNIRNNYSSSNNHKTKLTMARMLLKAAHLLNLAFLALKNRIKHFTHNSKLLTSSKINKMTRTII